MKRFLLLLIALMTPLSAWALSWEDMVPPPDDAAVMAIAYLFGDVGGLFGTGQTTVLGSMFSVFNSAMMMVGGILIGYIILSGTLKSAHEGEVLGRAWSSVWVPIRASVSMGMVLPGPAGYSLVQVFVMYCAIAGIGMGDKVWSIASQEMLFGHSEVRFSADTGQIVNGVLSGYTCSHALSKETISPVRIDPQVTLGSKSTIYDWGICGSVTIPRVQTEYKPINDLSFVKINLIEGVRGDLNNLGRAIAEGEQTQDQMHYMASLKTKINEAMSKEAKAAYERLANEDGRYGLVAKYGFIFAGAAYLQMADSYKTTSAVSNANVLIKGPNYQAMVDNFGATNVASKMTALKSFKSGTTDIAAEKANLPGAPAARMEGYSDGIQDQIEKALEDGAPPNMLDFLGPIGDGINFFFNGMGTFAAQRGASLTADGIGNPVIDMANFGDNMSTAVMATYVGAGIAIAVIEGFAGSKAAEYTAGLAFSIKDALKSVVTHFGPFFQMLCLALLAAGFTMSVYLPMLPMIIWTMAICGYLVLILESMVAAPLWAIMHASPDGHEWSGKGAQGYMIVMGVVLRPTLMIFGLVGAILLVNVMVMLMNVMFSYSAGLVSNTSGVGPLAAIVMVCLYAWLVTKIIHRSLQVITEVPSGIMKWIGGGHDPLGDDPTNDGKSFVGGIMNRGEGAAQASLGAKKGLGDQEKAKEQATAREEKEEARWKGLTEAVMGKSSGGASTGAPTNNSNAAG